MMNITSTQKSLKKIKMEDLKNYLLQSNEALRVENLKLLDQVERLTMNIEVIDAQIVSNGMPQYYDFINNFNYTLKKQ